MITCIFNLSKLKYQYLFILHNQVINKRKKGCIMKRVKNVTYITSCGEYALAPIFNGVESVFFELLNEPEFLENMGDFDLKPMTDIDVAGYVKAHQKDTWILAKKKRWNKRIEDIKGENPNFSQDKITREASKFSSKPSGNGPHQTGGAVDLTLADLDGNILFMGSEYSERSEKSYTNSKNISLDSKKYRKILKDSMEKFDFINYPAEWWHWSYGDRMWSAYTKKSYTIYRPIED
ncbi:MAG TPA: hypothetical protein EYG72_03405 [Candidatus Pacebacteria bacterium]|nr:hypothetical protein [Candidatus Paceibacterota bacterium]